MRHLKVHIVILSLSDKYNTIRMLILQLLYKTFFKEIHILRDI